VEVKGHLSYFDDHIAVKFRHASPGKKIQMIRVKTLEIRSDVHAYVLICLNVRMCHVQCLPSIKQTDKKNRKWLMIEVQRKV
jgi:hypothetical protein